MKYFVVNIFIQLSFVAGLATVSNAMPQLRLSTADVATSYSFRDPEGPGTYAFGYDINDPDTQNVQFRDEEKNAEGIVTGKYGWVAENGIVYVVNYISDTKGYRSQLETRPTLKLLDLKLLRRKQNLLVS